MNDTTKPEPQSGTVPKADPHGLSKAQWKQLGAIVAALLGSHGASGIYQGGQVKELSAQVEKLSGQVEKTSTNVAKIEGEVSVLLSLVEGPKPSTVPTAMAGAR
jgi:hypothetical protein